MKTQDMSVRIVKTLNLIFQGKLENLSCPGCGRDALNTFYYRHINPGFDYSLVIECEYCGFAEHADARGIPPEGLEEKKLPSPLVSKLSLR